MVLSVCIVLFFDIDRLFPALNISDGNMYKYMHKHVDCNVSLESYDRGMEILLKTLSQMTYLRPFQTQIVCRRQF